MKCNTKYTNALITLIHLKKKSNINFIIAISKAINKLYIHKKEVDATIIKLHTTALR